MTMTRSKGPILLLTACALLVFEPSIGFCQSDADFYKGKTITLTIGYGPGSGNDVYGR